MTAGHALVVGATSDIGTAIDVAGAVGYVVGFPGHGCPVLVELQPLAQG